MPEIRKEVQFLEVIKKLITYKLFKKFTSHIDKINLLIASVALNRNQIQLTGFYMRATLAINGLTSQYFLVVDLSLTFLIH